MFWIMAVCSMNTNRGAKRVVSEKGKYFRYRDVEPEKSRTHHYSFLSLPFPCTISVIIFWQVPEHVLGVGLNNCSRDLVSRV